MLSSFIFFLQGAPLETFRDTTATGDVVVRTVNKLSLFDLVAKGGWVMIPIGLLLVIGLFFFFERLLTLSKAAKVDPLFWSNLLQNIRAGNLDAALTICQTNAHPVARILEKGVSRLGSPVQEIESGMESAAQIEIAKLESNLVIVSTIATLAPMFGFLGTVFGMIKIFYDISLVDNLSIGTISDGIYEKMISSASGLLVGILAHLLSVILNARLHKVISSMQSYSVEFVDLLYKPGK